MEKERKAIIKNSDMTEDMQQDAINVATKAIDSYNIEKDIACYIKKEFDLKAGDVFFSSNTILYFSFINGVCFCIFDCSIHGSFIYYY